MGWSRSLPLRLPFGLILCALLLCLPRVAPCAPALPVSQALEVLRGAGFNIVYSSALLPPDVIELPSQPTPLAVNRLLQPLGLELHPLRDNTWILRRLDEPPPRAEGELILGVRDQFGNPRPGIWIRLAGREPAQTNASGEVRWKGLPVGEATLLIEDPATGGELEEKVRIKQAQTSRFTAVVNVPNQIETLVISSSRYQLLRRDPVSRNLLVGQQLHGQAAVANDAVRLVNQLPGSASNGLSARPRIRGGHEDETLILFDGVRLQEPFHLKDVQSLVSAFDPAVMNAIDVSSGGFPAAYGDRLSAVMRIEPLQPEAGRSKQLGLGLYGASGFYSDAAEGRPWDLLVSARRSTLELLREAVETDLGRPVFYDGLVRFNWRTAAGDRWSGNLFLLQDETVTPSLDAGEVARSERGSGYLWVALEQNHSEALSSRSLLSLARHNARREGTVDDPDMLVGRVDDEREFTFVDLSQRWQYLVSDESWLELGWMLGYRSGDYDYASQWHLQPQWRGLTGRPDLGARVLRRSLQGQDYALHTAWRQRLWDALTLEAGFRVDGQDKSDRDDHRQFSPRVNLLYKTDPAWEARLSWGRYFQSRELDELDVEDGVTRFDPAQASEHLVGSFNRRFDAGLELRLELYRKRIRTAADYFDNLYNTLSLLPELQPDRVLVSPESARAEGIELSVAGPIGDDGHWQASYSRARVRDRLADGWTNRSWDQPDAVDLGVRWRWGSWQSALHLAYHTGWPTTRLQLRQAAGDPGPILVPERRNRDRLDPYVSVDFKAIREFQLAHSTLRLEAGVVNLLNRRNPIGREYDLDLAAANPLDADSRSSLPVTPILDVFWIF